MNPFKALLGLLPARPLGIGSVVATNNGIAAITLIDGTVALARGDASVGSTVFFRDGAIEGTTTALPVEEIDI